MLDEVVTVDFETEAIGDRPSRYPPRPVGVAIKVNDSPGAYLSFAHGSENNCTEEYARSALAHHFERGVPIVCQNGKFDLEVAEAHWGFKIPDWRLCHDTQFLLYLYDPHARQLGLKPSAERILNWPPDEQDAVRDWVLSNVHKVKKSEFGAHIHKAPGGLVGSYAIGDVDRTYALFRHLLPYTIKHDMAEAYDLERELMPILLRAEQHGIRVDVELLATDLEVYEAAMERVSNELLKLLGTDSINLDSGAELATGLASAGLAKDFMLTPTGKRSTSQESLAGAVDNPHVLALLKYRGALKTCLTTFMRPWMAMAAGHGRLHTTWHQTRGEQAKGGTRTGRLSSSHPNFTNVPNDLARQPPPPGLPPLPLMRKYLLPEEGHVWLKRDYSSQEIRVLAHFEDGELMRRYQTNPNLDPHQFAADLIKQMTGNELQRSDTKRVAFSILYGSGAAALAADLGVDKATAQRFKDVYLAAFPGIRALVRGVKSMGRRGEPVVTVGGRRIFVERDGTGRDYSYKMINHLIQGSSADVTKMGTVNYARAGGAQLLALVHDEINVSCPADEVAEQAECLRVCMADVPVDVPLTSDLYIGLNWEGVVKQ
jgi:DNA polymerase I